MAPSRANQSGRRRAHGLAHGLSVAHGLATLARRPRSIDSLNCALAGLVLADRICRTELSVGENHNELLGESRLVEIGPGECKIVYGQSIGNRFSYYYAEGNGLVWSGPFTGESVNYTLTFTR